MPTCPDPAALTFWRNSLASSGGTLNLASLLLIQIAVRSRVSGWPLRLVSGHSVTFALGVAAISFVLFTHLSDLPAQLASWFPEYPFDCTPMGHGGPIYIAHMQALAQQPATSLERAAAIDLAVAIIALAALVTCAALCIRAVGRRPMTTVTCD